MVSKDVFDYIETNGIEKLYKKFEEYFKKVDHWSEIFAKGDLLNEYDLSNAMDILTGVYMQFHTIASAIDSYKTNKELDYSVSEFKKATKKPNVSQVGVEAREQTKQLRIYRGDFLNYAESAEKGILTCQARIKRLAFEKGARGIGDGSQQPPPQGWS
jgi:hypothetical protein